jgi:hypothetical protein
MITERVGFRIVCIPQTQARTALPFHVTTTKMALLGHEMKAERLAVFCPAGEKPENELR